MGLCIVFFIFPYIFALKKVADKDEFPPVPPVPQGWWWWWKVKIRAADILFNVLILSGLIN